LWIWFCGWRLRACCVSSMCNY